MKEEFETENGDQAAHVENGEWVEPISNPFGHGCCDCGLYHQVKYRVVSNSGVEIKGAKVQMRWERDRVETERLRGHMMSGSNE